MSNRKSAIPKKMKGKRKDRVWRHGQRINLHCGRCGGHVDGTLKIEGPQWMFYCDGGHHVAKGLINDRQVLIDLGRIHVGGLDDPRYTARKQRISEDARKAKESQVYGERFKEVGHHNFI